MGVIRRLVTVVELQADKAAKALAAYDRLWKQTAKSIDGYAASVEADANRVVAATERMAAAMANVSRAGRGGGGGKNAPAAKTPRKGGDDLDRAIVAANKAEAARAAQQSRAGAQMAGLAAGSAQVRDAANALGQLATKSDRARAAVKDLETQVARNRKEMADLKAQALATGDADGTLAARMKGLAVATGQATVQLADARKELRAVDGGLIDAVKNVKGFSLGLGALSVAAGNFISAGLSRAFHEIKGAVFGATEKAIKFESSFADVKKVLPDSMSVAQVDALEAGLKKLGPAVGVLPTQMAELTAGLAQSGIAGQELLPIAEHAAKIGVAFDLSGKEAGAAFASIQAALGTSREKTNDLFDTINELSNGMNSTAAQLVEVEQRVGSVGKAMSLSGETVAALGSALVSTGASSEVAATGVRTFLARLGAGEAATDKQLKAFEALGLSAKDVARELSSGDTARAEKQIRGVVEAIEGLSQEDTLPTLIELFGSESIGTIGALATNTKLLGTAFEIAGNKTKSAGSVLKEFENRSKTTEHQLQRVKAGAEVLAIEFGKALLPVITQVADYLNSPEGQEWGRAAVADLTAGVKSLVAGLQEAWGVVQTVGGALSTFTDAIGGTTVAIGLLSAAMLALTGPFVAVPVLATAAGAAIGQFAVDSITAGRAMAEQTASNMQDVATSLGQGRDKFAVLRDILGEVTQSTDRSRAAWAAWMQQMLGATGAVERFYDAEQAGKIRSGRISEDAARRQAVDAARLAHAQRTKAAKEANDAAIFNNADSRFPAGGPGGGAQARFDALSAKVRAGQKLKPSEAKEYTALSKRLDEAKATKAGKGHKATKMDRQLAAMDPSVRALLTRGGETDAGGDLKRADNVLDRAVFAKATGSGGGGGSSPGPGPNVTTIYNDNKTLVNVHVDASSSGPVAENIRQAAQDLGASVSSVRFTGQAKVVANRNAGGRMA